MTVNELDPLELKRRIAGYKFTELSIRTHIPYKRLWRFFRGDGPLTRVELARLDAALATPLQERPGIPSVATVAGTPAAHDGNEDAPAPGQRTSV